MEDQELVEVNSDQPKRSGTPILWGGVAIVVILLGALMLMAGRKDSSNLVADNPTPGVEEQVAGTETDTEEPGEEVAENEETEENAEELAGGTSELAMETFEIEGGSFYFKPNKITVKKGQPVKITFNNVNGFHDLVIDELDVKTSQIQAGETTSVEFTPEKTGTFEYYCSVGNHRQMGMVGTLVVEE